MLSLVAKHRSQQWEPRATTVRAFRGVWPVQVLSSLVWYSSNVESIYWEHSPPLLTFEAWLFQCKQVKAIGTKDHALMRQDALNTSRAVVEAVKASAWTKWLSEYIYIIYNYIYIMYDLNDLVQNLSTSRFTFLRTLWSNQWHLSTVSWVQKALLVIRIALRGLTIGWGQPLFIFALKWLHQYTVSLKMPNEKIRHGIACTMLHQFCTVQLSIIKSWPLQNAAKTKAVYKTRDPACGSSLRRTWKQRLKQHGCWGF